MATEWFYQSMGNEFGPFSNRELIEEIHERRVKPDTMVRKNDSRWVAARAVNGLLERAGIHLDEQKCPTCGRLLERHEEFCSLCGRQIEKATIATRASGKSTVAAVQSWLSSVT